MPAKSLKKRTAAGKTRTNPAVLKRARELSAAFSISISRDGRSGYVGRVSELPTVFGCGTTDVDALRATRESLRWALVYLIEGGRRVPSPSQKRLAS